MRNNTLRQNTGFTLIELMIYFGLLSVLLLFVSQIFLTALETQSSTAARSTIQEDGRYVIAKLTYDINRATSITTPATPSGQLTNTLALVISGSTYTYSLSNNSLVVTGPSGTDYLTGYDAAVANLQFQRLGNPNGKNTIQINFTLESTTDTKTVTPSRTYQTSIGIRPN